MKKNTYDFEGKKLYHQVLAEAVTDRFTSRKNLRAICFPGHEMLEVERVLLTKGFNPRNIYCMEADYEIMHEIKETNKRKKLGVPDRNFLLGYDYEIFQKVGGNFHYINLDYQGILDNRKLFAMSLAANLLANEGLFATNFLGKRETDSGQRYSHTLAAEKALERINVDIDTLLGLDIKDTFPDRFKSALDQYTINPISANRRDAITLSAYNAIDLGYAGLNLIDPVISLLISLKKVFSLEQYTPLEELLNKYQTTTDIYEKFCLVNTEFTDLRRVFALTTIQALRNLGYPENQAAVLHLILLEPFMKGSRIFSQFRGNYKNENNTKMYFDIFATRRSTDLLKSEKFRFISSEDGPSILGLVPYETYSSPNPNSLPPEIRADIAEQARLILAFQQVHKDRLQKTEIPCEVALN